MFKYNPLFFSLIDADDLENAEETPPLEIENKMK